MHSAEQCKAGAHDGIYSNTKPNLDKRDPNHGVQHQNPNAREIIGGKEMSARSASSCCNVSAGLFRTHEIVRWPEAIF